MTDSNVIPFPGRHVNEQAHLLFSYTYDGADYFGQVSGTLGREVFYRVDPCLVVLVETLPDDLIRSIEFHEYAALEIELIFLSHHAERGTILSDILFTPAGLKLALGPSAHLYRPRSRPHP